MGRLFGGSLTMMMAALALAACTETRTIQPALFLQPPPTQGEGFIMLMQAKGLETSGISTPEQRREHFRLLDDACERANLPDACILADADDPTVGPTLLYHGCVLGSVESCDALVHVETTRQKKTPAQANADAERALELGCSFGSAGACTVHGNLKSFIDRKALHDRMEKAPNAARETIAASSNGAETQSRLARDETQTLRACALSCSINAKACMQRCFIGTDGAGACKPCQDEAASCVTTCRLASHDACMRRFPLYCDDFKLGDAPIP